MSATAVLSEATGARVDPKEDNKPRRERLEYVRVVGEDAVQIDACYGIKDPMIEINPGRVLLPHSYKVIGERILDLKVREDDVWLVSYPRTGSTWAQEMVWCIGNGMDLETARTTIQQLRTPMLELTCLLAYDLEELREELGDSVDAVTNMESPRFIKSHLPWDLLPDELSTVNPKIIYVTRNPKDMCVSYFHYCKLIHNFLGTMEEFVELFLRDRAPFGPFWNNLLSFWSRRHQPNILFLKYEDMKRDQEGAIRQTASFLGKHISESDVKRLAEHLSFNTMKKNPAVNLEPILERDNGPDFLKNTELRFIRKGQVGDWKNHFTPELADRFDKWTEDNLRGTGLSFD